MNTVTRTEGNGVSWRRVVGRVATGTAVAALAVTALGGVPAQAATGAGGARVGAESAVRAGGEAAAAKKWYFEAGLLGRNEVKEPGKKVNDRDGAAVAKFRIVGKKIFYVVAWKRTGKPTAFHIHRGKAGTNGPVVIDLLANGVIRGNTSFGSVVVKDLSVLNGIKKNPHKWYANLHTKEFPDGAVRGQLHKGARW